MFILTSTVNYRLYIYISETGYRKKRYLQQKKKTETEIWNRKKTALTQKLLITGLVGGSRFQKKHMVLIDRKLTQLIADTQNISRS